MPFDAGLDTEKSSIDLYRQRRDVAADIWRSVPKENFMMSIWHCGTRACALGWLGILRHDGWQISGTFPLWLDQSEGAGRYAPIIGAARYFGISVLQAENLFTIISGDNLNKEAIGESLLALPYTIHKSEDQIPLPLVVDK